MKIAKLYQNNFQPTFKADLYYKKGSITQGYVDCKDIAECGNRNTDIFVKRVISTKNRTGGFNNSVSFEIQNPLLGSKDFFVKNMHETNDKITDKDFVCDRNLYSFFTKFDTIEQYENETLKNTLLNKVHEASLLNKKNANDIDEETNPEKIFNNIFADEYVKDAGFSDKRIDELKQVSKDLTNEIILLGSDLLLKKSKLSGADKST